ncbi:hypothetical protein, partial [Klebsiella pneumoniae]|uniref:hypothetical protein n=1 Tax=Klebsiella pneumoniae TaxID=573 RepID=UPI003012A2DF
ASLKDSKVNSDDIAYFAPELKDWKKEVKLSGNFSGTVDNFNTSGNISSDLGGLYTNVQMKFPNKQEPIYSGDVTTK